MNQRFLFLIVISVAVLCITIGSAISPIIPVEGSYGEPSSGLINPVITPSVDLKNPEKESEVLSVSSESSFSNETTPFQRGLMHFSEEELREKDAARALLTKAVSYSGSDLPKTSKSLLDSVPYIGNNRDQGYCGNCWVWASTGALEIAHTINNNVKDRLSVQYFNSNYNGGAVTGNACKGGFTEQAAEFYSNTLKKTIPWSNTNAGYADYNWNGGPSGISADKISTTPNYPLINVTDEPLETHISQISAINNIKSQINANKPVLWYYALPTAGWTAFNHFWADQPETAIWDPDPYAGTELNGAHEVLIIGYDDTGSSPYWLVLNSWGTTTGRPNGLFRLKMNLNYDATMTYGSYTQYAHYFDIFHTTYVTPTPTPTPSPTPTTTPTASPTPTLSPTPTPTVSPTPTPSPEYGNLTVTSSPNGATIRIDGSSTGYLTPATIENIQVGTHTISLEKTGYVTYYQTFSIISGQTTEISTTLIPTGTLSVSSRPNGASIWIDDTDSGRVTPTKFFNLTPGSHEVRLIKTGYTDYSKTVTIQNGIVTTVYGILTSTGGKIAISSNPSGAVIFIDGVDTKYQTPKTISGLVPGNHTILLKKNGYLDWTKTVYVNAKMTTTVQAGLLPGGSNGSVFVYSNPSGASVSIDNIPIGYYTPKTISGIPGGEHILSLNMTGYNDWSKTITVRPGVKTTVYGRLVKKG